MEIFYYTNFDASNNYKFIGIEQMEILIFDPINLYNAPKLIYRQF